MSCTNFGKIVKKQLVDMDKTQKWLLDQIAEKTGLYVDSSYLARIFNGERHPQKIIKAICEILQINDTE